MDYLNERLWIPIRALDFIGYGIYFDHSRFNDELKEKKMKKVQLYFPLLQIAFSNLYVMDSRETAVRTGAQAKPEYRGLGITEQVGQASLRAA